jgi:hypothetical protein
MGYAQIVESTETASARGNTIRVQGKVRTSAVQTVRIALLEWKGDPDTVTRDVVNDWTSGTFETANFFGSGLTLTVVGVEAVTTEANTWADISVSGSVSSSCQNLIIFVWSDSVQANNTLQLAEMDAYIGTAARTWSPRPYAQELLLCQRYCYAALFLRQNGFRQATNLIGMNYCYAPVTMRATAAPSHNISAYSTATPTGTEVQVLNNTAGGGAITISGGFSAAIFAIDPVCWRLVFTAVTSFSGNAGDLTEFRLGPSVRLLLEAEL